MISCGQVYQVHDSVWGLDLKVSKNLGHQQRPEYTMIPCDTDSQNGALDFWKPHLICVDLKRHQPFEAITNLFSWVSHCSPKIQKKPNAKKLGLD